MKKKKKSIILSIASGIIVGMAIVMPISLLNSFINRDVPSKDHETVSESLNNIVSNNIATDDGSVSNGVILADNGSLSEDSVSENIIETVSENTVSEEITDAFIPTEPTLLLSFEPLDINSIPEYTGEPYCIINNNVPAFTELDLLNPVFEYYSDLDDLGRCGVATARIGTELMPTEERGEIGYVKPSGWQTVKYPDLISDLYLYNRCHLIAWCLCGENANEQNLITGTRYMNVSGMLPFEDEILDYIKATDNTVLYRVTPIFVDSELVARGVHMEGYSVEDNGSGICFNVFVYNVQPGISIDYATGDSWITEE